MKVLGGILILVGLVEMWLGTQLFSWPNLNPPRWLDVLGTIGFWGWWAFVAAGGVCLRLGRKPPPDPLAWDGILLGMKAKPIQCLAVGWLVSIGGLTIAAVLMTLLWVTGLYDPVEHDGIHPESLPWLAARLVIVPLLFLATYRKAMRYANQ
jgi:hypothetical protein